MRRQNPLELVIEDISTFDGENPIVGSLLKKLNAGKKLATRDLVKNAPGIPGQDFEIQNRLNRLRNIDTEPKNNNNNNNKNNLSPPSSPPLVSPSTGPFIPPPPPPLNPHRQFVIHFNHHHQDLIIL